MESNENVWHVIKAQTALGKTETYLELLKNTSLKILIAVPTLKLKHEVRERAAAMGIEMIESPSLRELELPDDIQNHIDHIYKSGKSPIPYLHKNIKEDNPECAAVFKRYLKELKEFTEFDGLAITTHKRLLTMDTSKYDLVIIDEDIIFSTIIPGKVDINISDLKRLLKKTGSNSALKNKILKAFKHIKESKEEFFTLPKIGYNETDNGTPIGVDVPSFCLAKYFCYRKAFEKESDLKEDCISFFKPVSFKKNTKYIMVSATVDETICKHYFGENNVKFYDCKKARYQGTLDQFYDKSMSRACINKDPTVIDRIKKWSGFKHTISFKKYQCGDLHFGNTAGCDYLKGENIDVIGTHHQQEWIYKIFAYSLGLDCDINEKLKTTTVDHNGYRFCFTTYTDKLLKDIQFYIIESELEQAVGRKIIKNELYCQFVFKLPATSG